MTINAQPLGAWILRLAAVAGVVVSAINPADVPPSWRTTLLAISGAILAIDRIATEPSIGNPVPPTPVIERTPPTTPPAPPAA